MIRVAEVTWSYPAADAPSLEHLSLAIAPGEFVVLCGASGSGKSTALRLMNGLIPHFHEEGALSGSVWVDGVLTAAAELDEIGARTGSVLQHPRRQFFTDTAPEEIAFAMENFGADPERIRARVEQSLAALATAMPITERLQQLSGGQQQQVAIAAASTHDPRILLLDEPSSNLSADAVDRLVTTLTGLKAEGVTIVVAEHRLRYLQGLLDRVVVMRDGRIDRGWHAAEFAAVPDAELAREGLRGAIVSVELPRIAAAGASVATAHSEPQYSGFDTVDDTSGTDAHGEADGTTTSHRGSLELTGVRCRLGGRTVIDLEEASFARGAVTAIRGANGTGKSTLARIITGLQRASGTVRLDGRRLSLRRRQRASAIVMQDVQRQLFTDSVAAEIDLAAVSRGRSAPASASTSEVLDALDLTHLAERHPLSLSGGQQQRLVVAAVRLAGRDIVVFDEPSSGVDRRHLQSISEQIRGVAADGAVVLLISHDEDLLALAADRQLALATAHRSEDADDGE